MAADPKYSAGARAERKSFRSYLRRQLKIHGSMTGPYSNAVNAALAWVLKRQERYDKARGGLGR